MPRWGHSASFKRRTSSFPDRRGNGAELPPTAPAACLFCWHYLAAWPWRPPSSGLAAASISPGLPRGYSALLPPPLSQPTGCFCTIRRGSCSRIATCSLRSYASCEGSHTFGRRSLDLPPIEEQHARVVKTGANRRARTVQIPQDLGINFKLRREDAAELRKRSRGDEARLARRLVV